MLEARNLSSHIYNESKMKDIADEISEDYIAELDTLKDIIESKI